MEFTNSKQFRKKNEPLTELQDVFLKTEYPSL